MAVSITHAFVSGKAQGNDSRIVYGLPHWDAEHTTEGLTPGTDIHEFDSGLSSLVRQNLQSADYTTVLTDIGYHIYHPLADNNARTFTIDSNANVAYPIGTPITFVNEVNVVTIAITSDTLLLAGTGSVSSVTLAAGGTATALKIDSTKWIISGSGLYGGGGAEAVAFLARTTGLDATHIAAYIALIDGLVADGIWPLLDLLHVYATQDSTTALLNLVSTSYNGTKNGAPTFTADRGFTGTAASSTIYINTNFNPNTAVSPHYTLNNCHLSAWNLTNATSATGIFGGATTQHSYIIPKFNGDNLNYFRLNLSSPSGGGVANANAIGLYTVNRSTVLLEQGYKNGASVLSESRGSAVVPNLNFYSLGLNISGTASGVALQTAMVAVGSSLDATQAANFYARLRTYGTAVGVP